MQIYFCIYFHIEFSYSYQLIHLIVEKVKIHFKKLLGIIMLVSPYGQNWPQGYECEAIFVATLRSSKCSVAAAGFLLLLLSEHDTPRKRNGPNESTILNKVR